MVFFFLVIVSLAVFWTPLRTLLDYSTRGGHEYDKYSHIVLIPFITMAMVYFERSKIFTSVQYDYRIGVILLLLGLFLDGGVALAGSQLDAQNMLSSQILALVIFWMGGFILCYGTQAFRAGAFPLLFLLLAVPIPDFLLDVPISAVRYGSTEVCSLIFSLTGMPFMRNGFEFTLPDIQIEVAKECSGIHSTLALFIVALIAGHLTLKSPWKKVLLILFVLPVVCISNGFRIAGLTLLSVYVDPRFMYSNLHREGGIGFFLLALLLLFAVLHLLRRAKREAVSG
jgi:exosortase